MAILNTTMFASVVESSVAGSTVSVSGPLAGMFGAPTSEPLIDSQIDAEASAAPVPESPISPVAVAVASDASDRQAQDQSQAFAGVRGRVQLRAHSRVE